MILETKNLHQKRFERYTILHSPFTIKVLEIKLQHYLSRKLATIVRMHSSWGDAFKLGGGGGEGRLNYNGACQGFKDVFQ